MSSWLDTINFALTIGVCVMAVWKGGQPERAAGVTFFLAWLLSLSAWSFVGLLNAQLIVLGIDSLLLASFGFLAWKSGRGWLTWATAFLSIDVAIHLSTLMNLRVVAFAYGAALWLSAYGVLGSIAVGTWMAWREREALSGSPSAF